MLKKLISIIAIALLAFTVAGCGSRKVVPNPKPSNEDDNHIVVDQKDLKLAVSDVPKNLKNLVTATQPNKIVISINVTITNHKTDQLHINPDFVTITTDKNNTYKWYADDSVILGKSAFRDFLIPGGDGKGGGKLTFEINPDENVTSLNYKDDSGHDITVKYNNPDTKI